MIAAALSLAGMPGAKRGRRKSSLELTGSAVSKWLDACMSDDHQFAELFDRSVKTIATKEFLAGGPDERDDVLRYKINELCDVVALHYGDRRDADAEPRIVYFYRLATGLRLTNEARGNLGLEFP